MASTSVTLNDLEDHFRYLKPF